MRIKTGDEVVVIKGKYKGVKGEVLDVFKAEEKLVVKDVNVSKIHEKPRGPQNPGGIIETERPIHASNVMLYCPKCGQGVRYGIEIKDGKKVRVCRKCDYAFD